MSSTGLTKGHATWKSTPLARQFSNDLEALGGNPQTLAYGPDIFGPWVPQPEKYNALKKLLHFMRQQYNCNQLQIGFNAEKLGGQKRDFFQEQCARLDSICDLTDSGLLTFAGNTALARSIVGGDGILVDNGNGVAGEPTVNIDTLLKALYEGMSRRFVAREDFNGPMVGLAPSFNSVRVVNSGAGAGSIAAPGANKNNRPGIIRLSTGTTVGRSFLISDSNNGFHIGGDGLTRCGTNLQVGPTLATALEDYHLRAGIMSITAAPPSTIVFGVGFEYDRATSLNWQIFTDATGLNAVPTSVLVSINTTYRLEFEVNAAADSVEFFIGGVSVGTLSTVADIPSGPGFNLFYNSHIYKIAGVTPRTVDFDSLYLYKEVVR